MKKYISLILISALILGLLPSFGASAAYAAQPDEESASILSMIEQPDHYGRGDVNEIHGELTYVDGPMPSVKKSLPKVNASSYPTIFSEPSYKYYYPTLSDDGKKIYNKLCQCVSEFTGSALYNSDLDKNSCKLHTGLIELSSPDSVTIRKAVFAFLRDQVQYYFILSGYSGTLYSDGVDIYIEVDSYYWLSSRRAAADKAIKDLLDDWVPELQTILNDTSSESNAEKRKYLTALRLHDLIINRIDYTYNSLGQPEESKYAHSIAGIATEQGVVCEGYADMFSYILNRIGMESLIIIGFAPGAHAWNAVKLDGKYYLCDVTWDDHGAPAVNYIKENHYSWFCTPRSVFNTKHTADNELTYPSFADDYDYMYSNYFKAYSASALTTTEQGKTLRDSGLSHQYSLSDVVEYQLPAQGVEKLTAVLDSERIASMYYSPYGVAVEYISLHVSTPATSVTLNSLTGSSETEAVSGSSIALKESQSFRAHLNEGTDDRIVWTVEPANKVSVRTDNDTITITGRHNGVITLTVSSYTGSVTSSISLIIGRGDINADYIIWAGGDKEHKTCTIDTSMVATDWTDSKGKEKKGKLVWLISDTDITVRFDTTKHTVTNKVTHKNASVNATKHTVTASKPGSAFVYVCDTGSLTYERYEIEIRAGATKISLSNNPGSLAKSDVTNKININVGDSKTLYVVPYRKDTDPAPESTYTVAPAKEIDQQYVLTTAVENDSEGNPKLTIWANDYLHDEKYNKAVTAKLIITNTETGKKTTLSVVIGNPAINVSYTPSNASASLAEKMSTYELTLNITSQMGSGYKTTDTVKVYVAKSSVTLKSTGKQVICDKGATVSVKLDAKTNTVTLKANKAAHTPAVIYVACTDAVTKLITLYPLCRVDENGQVTSL